MRERRESRGGGCAGATAGGREALLGAPLPPMPAPQPQLMSRSNLGMQQSLFRRKRPKPGATNPVAPGSHVGGEFHSPAFPFSPLDWEGVTHSVCRASGPFCKGGMTTRPTLVPVLASPPLGMAGRGS
ncbi:UNVERIFIED_CONTAM: hypothetical protein K2H54_027897 [Gekko kuhli]